jgi:hypothetical protein
MRRHDGLCKKQACRGTTPPRGAGPHQTCRYRRGPRSGTGQLGHSGAYARCWGAIFVRRASDAGSAWRARSVATAAADDILSAARMPLSIHPVRIYRPALKLDLPVNTPGNKAIRSSTIVLRDLYCKTRENQVAYTMLPLNKKSIIKPQRINQEQIMTCAWSRLFRAGSLSVFAVAVASCGGGKDGAGECYSPTPGVCSSLGVDRSLPQAIVSPEGLYKGITIDRRAITTLVLDDDSFYAIYSEINKPLVAAGGIQGTVRAETRATKDYDVVNFLVNYAVEIDLTQLDAQIYALAGTYVQKQYIQTPTFLANYNSDYQARPNLADITGKYIGTNTTASGSETITFDIDASGNITGSGDNRCKFSGTVTPRTNGNVYNLTITFDTSPCQFAGTKVNGVSYFDRSSNIAYAMASTPTGNARFITIATKQ